MERKQALIIAEEMARLLDGRVLFASCPASCTLYPGATRKEGWTTQKHNTPDIQNLIQTAFS